MKLELTYEVSKDFLDNVITSATESGVHGVDSWMTVERWLKRDGFRASFDLSVGLEGNREGRVTLRRRDVLRGIERLLHPAVNLGSSVRGRLVVALINDDTGEIDGPLADLIIQAAVFNDVIYG